MKIRIDCPICSSGNYFQVGQIGQKLLCEDCGFLLSEESKIERVDFAKCLFCGNAHFYLESPFSLSILGHDSICYVCEAQYKNTKIGNPDAKYNPISYENAQQTIYAKRWHERAEQYSKHTEKN